MDTLGRRVAGVDALAGAELAPYALFPYTLPDGYARTVLFFIDPTQSTLAVDSTPRRGLLDPSVVAYLPNPTWAGSLSSSSPITVSLTVKIMSGSAGLALRVVEDAGNTLTYYRLMLHPSSVTGDATDPAYVWLERVVQQGAGGAGGPGTVTVVSGSVAPGSALTALIAGQPLNVSLSMSAAGAFSATLNGATLFSGALDSVGLLPSGSAGFLTSAGLTYFSYLSVSTPCDAGGAAITSAYENRCVRACVCVCLHHSCVYTT